MNNDGFVMLWGKTLDSSVWRRESKETRLVWVTLLMMKNSEGIVQSSRVGLADRARVSDEECDLALTVLLSPDPDDTSKIDDGIRIKEIPGGWQIVNHDLYRFSTAAKREFWREQKAKQRERDKAKLAPGPKKWPSESERQFIKAEGNGDLEGADNATKTRVLDGGDAI